MVYACCVPTCNNNGKVRGVSLHSFTKDPALGKLWIDRINLDTHMSKLDPRPLTVSKYTKICSAHFKKTDYSVGSGLNRLNPDAVPTLFPWTSKRIFRQSKQKELLLESLEELQQLTELEQRLEGFDARAKYSGGSEQVPPLPPIDPIQLQQQQQQPVAVAPPLPPPPQENSSEATPTATDGFDTRARYSDGSSDLDSLTVPQEHSSPQIKVEVEDDLLKTP